MLQEVIIAEGKQDVVAIKRAVDAEVITTGGFTLNAHTLEKIAIAYKKRGIIILTDPDKAGESIRRFLSKKFPNAKHAFVPLEDAYQNNDIGIEQASPQAIALALSKVRSVTLQNQEIFNIADIWSNNLSGSPQASQRRALLGAALGIGYANAKQFLYRLNHYGVTRSEFEQALADLPKGCE